MDLYRPVCRHVVAPLWAAWERSPYLRELRSMERRQYEEPELVREYQQDAMRKIVRHAASKCSYYSQAYARAGVDPEDINTLDDLRHCLWCERDAYESIETTSSQRMQIVTCRG